MRLLLVLVCVSLVNAQCDENSCTVLCYPVHWQRDLCQFYQQLTVWRNSASGCGLSLPALPESRPGLWPEGVSSSEEQWQIASEYWQEVTSLWERRYDSAQESVTVSPLIVMTTNAPSIEPTNGILTPDNNLFSGSGSGSDITTDLPTMATTTMATDEPTTAEPGASMLNNRERWNASNEEWELLFTRWVESSQQGAGLRLPSDVDVGVVIDSYSQNEQMNREAWSRLVRFWRENHDVYNENYNGVCPE